MLPYLLLGFGLVINAPVERKGHGLASVVDLRLEYGGVQLCMANWDCLACSPC
jgi:hypothetical protein